MLYVQHGGKIRLTRGDTAMLTVVITNETTGKEYVVAKDDTLTMTIKRDTSETEPLIQKNLVGLNTFHIQPNDTSNLEFGEYEYDVQLTTASGEVYTVIEPSPFVVLKEVTR